MPTAEHHHVLIEFYLPLLKRILAQHVVLLARFVGIVLLDQIRLQMLFGQNVDVGDTTQVFNSVYI